MCGTPVPRRARECWAVLNTVWWVRKMLRGSWGEGREMNLKDQLSGTGHHCQRAAPGTHGEGTRTAGAMLDSWFCCCHWCCVWARLYRSHGDFCWQGELNHLPCLLRPFPPQRCSSQSPHHPAQTSQHPRVPVGQPCAAPRGWGPGVRLGESGSSPGGAIPKRPELVHSFIGSHS